MDYELNNNNGEIVDLKNAIDYKNDPDVIVFDTNAKKRDDLKKSYVGKYIVQCDICDQLLYSDDKDLTTIKECPYCGFDDCFYVVGIVQAVPTEEFVDEYHTDDITPEEKTDLVYGEATEEKDGD